VLDEKCAHVGMKVPTAASIRSSPFRAEIESEWENMLGHQLPKPLAPFRGFWDALHDVFSWLAGMLVVRAIPRAELGRFDATWEAPKAITSWRHRVPLELLCYAGANRFTVDVDYRAEHGLQGRQRAELYSLRRTPDGNLVLFVVNDPGQLRSYRADRITVIRPTTVSFTTKFRVEF
jgi:hypothetical protein